MKSAKVGLRCEVCVLKGALRVGGKWRGVCERALRVADREYCALARRGESVGIMQLDGLREDL